jgi:hypothetical protein
MDEDKFIAALGRKFRAVEVDPPPPPQPSSTPRRRRPVRDQVKCAVCRRTTHLVVGDDGRAWCREPEWDACNRIAQSRLGASAAVGSASALTGQLEPDGKCRSCKEPVKWVKTQRGKKMPVDVIPAPPEVDAFELIGRTNTLAFYISEKRRAMHVGDVYQSHFQTCGERDT